MTVGKLIRERRLKKNIKQTDIAKELGYTSQFVANWERGISNPPLKKLKAIAEILGVSHKSIKKVMLSDYKKKLDEALK